MAPPLHPRHVFYGPTEDMTSDQALDCAQRVLSIAMTFSRGMAEDDNIDNDGSDADTLLEFMDFAYGYIAHARTWRRPRKPRPRKSTTTGNVRLIRGDV